jgi:hypothetical protein
MMTLATRFTMTALPRSTATLSLPAPAATFAAALSARATLTSALWALRQALVLSDLAVAGQAYE